MRYDLTLEQLYSRYQDAEHPIARMYWLDKLRERVRHGCRRAQAYVDKIELCDK